MFLIALTCLTFMNEQHRFNGAEQTSLFRLKLKIPVLFFFFFFMLLPKLGSAILLVLFVCFSPKYILLWELKLLRLYTDKILITLRRIWI